MGDVEVGYPEVADCLEVAESNDYVKKLMQSADLHILQPGVVNAAYERVNKELGLFHLFLLQIFLETVCKWMNEALKSKGKICSIKEFYDYLGHEMGMSIARYNDIKRSIGQKNLSSSFHIQLDNVFDTLLGNHSFMLHITLQAALCMKTGTGTCGSSACQEPQDCPLDGGNTTR
jgi:hypothetical protein